MELMELKKFTLLLVPMLLAVLASVPSVAAQTENVENRVSTLENQVQTLSDQVSELSNQISGLSSQMENMRENYSDVSQHLESSVSKLREAMEEQFDTSQQLENSVSKLEKAMGGLSGQVKNLGQTVQKMQEEEKKGTITVVALTEDGMKPLNFGMFSGGSSPMTMFMMMQQGGGMFSIPTVKPMTPIMLMGEHGLVQDATIDAYATSENGFMPINLQASGGMTVIPPVGGFISGTVSAPNYDETTFYVKVGKAQKKKKLAGEVEIKSTPKVLKPESGAVVKAVRNGKIIEDATLSIFGKEHPNPAQITVPKTSPRSTSKFSRTGRPSLPSPCR